MKKAVKLIVAAIFTVILAVSCTTIKPVGATGNAVGSKHGEAESMTICGIVIKPKIFCQDNAIETAAKNGGITKISTVDYKTFGVFPFFVKTTTIVTGE